MTHRFFIPPDWLAPQTVTLRGATARQLRTVLRMRPGDTIMVLDNSGEEYQVHLTELGPETVLGRIVSQQPAKGEPALHLTLYQGTLKAQKFEWVLQKGTELGVSRFVPVVCQRSVVRDSEDLVKKRQRWERIIQEAAEQSGRGRLPRLEPALPLDEALGQAQADPLRLMFWEQASDSTLKAALSGVKPGRAALLVGPEGGFTTGEARSARHLGCRLIKLGPRILRAETAGLAVAAAIMFQQGEWD